MSAFAVFPRPTWLMFSARMRLLWALLAVLTLMLLTGWALSS